MQVGPSGAEVRVMPQPLGAGGTVVDGPEIFAEVRGVVIGIDDMVATIEMGDDRDEWVFPRSMLPPEVVVDSVLTFDRPGSGATVIGHSAPAPSVEDRLGRALNRRRLHLG
jgi:hypothetical protein